MERTFRRAAIALTFVTLVAVLTACGSGGDGTTAASTAGEATTAAATQPPPFTSPTNAGGGGFLLASPSFGDGDAIPRKFTCQGDGVSPALNWLGVPAGTRSLALLVVDPDAPVDGGFTHWVLAGIDPAHGGLAEGTTDGAPGANSAGDAGYAGPCPPSGTHHYVFTLYALATPIDGTPDRAAIEAAGKNALGTAVLTGTYEQS